MTGHHSPDHFTLDLIQFIINHVQTLHWTKCGISHSEFWLLSLSRAVFVEVKVKYHLHFFVFLNKKKKNLATSGSTHLFQNILFSNKLLSLAVSFTSIFHFHFHYVPVIGGTWVHAPQETDDLWDQLCHHSVKTIFLWVFMCHSNKTNSCSHCTNANVIYYKGWYFLTSIFPKVPKME